ncbi:MAG: hypothetical protein IJX26_04415 [Clostridia bacterium]|nr:hypothetical protein [Clostridia bacterium]
MNKSFLFKIMFAIEIALLPIIISAKMIMPELALSVVVGLILVAKLVMVVIKNPGSTMDIYLDAIGNGIVIVFCLITAACYDYINLVLAIITSVVFVLEEVLRVYFYYKPNNQLVDALNFAVELFIFVTLSSFMMINISNLMLQISTIALLIASAFLVGIQTYKFLYYYVFKKNKRNKY